MLGLELIHVSKRATWGSGNSKAMLTVSTAATVQWGNDLRVSLRKVDQIQYEEIWSQPLALITNHWLLNKHRIEFKTLMIIFKGCHDEARNYNHELITACAYKLFSMWSSEACVIIKVSKFNFAIIREIVRNIDSDSFRFISSLLDVKYNLEIMLCGSHTVLCVASFNSSLNVLRVIIMWEISHTIIYLFILS